MDLYVVRHGEVPSNIEGILSGWSEEKLTKKGIKQAKQARKLVKKIKFDAIYASPIERTKETAEIIEPKREIIFDNRLAERELGEMLGKLRADIDISTWNSIDTDKTPEGAETLGAGLKRLRNFLDELYEKYREKTILIVTHNFVSKCIWVIENNVQDQEEIDKFTHENSEIKFYKESI